VRSLPFQYCAIALHHPLRFFLSSLISFAWKDNACITKQQYLPLSQSLSPLHESLIGYPLPGCLHSFYTLPVHLRRPYPMGRNRAVLGGGTSTVKKFLTEGSKRSPCPRLSPSHYYQARHGTSRKHHFLADSSRLTEILHVLNFSAPVGLVLTVLYWIWSLPLVVISPPKALILRDPSTPLAYTGHRGVVFRNF